MNRNEKIKESILEIVHNQLQDNTPPETRLTYERLQKEGYDDLEIREMIGECLSIEIFEILKMRKQYNKKRYISNLLALPEGPID